MALVVNENPLRTLDPPAVQRLDTIRVPTLILIGERDVPDCHAIAERVTPAFPKRAQGGAATGGAYVEHGSPERFNALLLDFLTKQ
jgi:pimeloyl-ACP methyl ester carboxylesterase